MKLFYSISFFLLFGCCSIQAGPTPVLKDGFGKWAIGKELYQFILDHVKEGDTIVELGSGYSTKVLSNHFHVHTVEHNKEFLDVNRAFMDSGRYPVHFILAPIVTLQDERQWYDPDILKQSLPKKSRLVVVDGPLGKIGRYSFIDYLHLFKTDYIVLDDLDRPDELKLLKDIARKLKKRYRIHNCKKPFGYIYTR